jgi:hypothetical protein
MKKLSVACLFVALFACESSDPTISYNVTPELSVYVDTFFAEAEKRGIILSKENLVVQLIPQKDMPDYQGLSTKEGDQRIIKIQKELYEYYSGEGCASYYDEKYGPNRLEILMFHELGHTILGREHTDGESYMSIEFITPVIPYEEEDRTPLVDELFSNQ